jgi:hypothetical protein
VIDFSRVPGDFTAETMAKEYDVDKIVNDVDEAVLAGKCRRATEKESLELRLAALENIACKELVEKVYSEFIKNGGEPMRAGSAA